MGKLAVISVKKTEPRSRQGGFTAIELVIAAGVFSIVLIVALSGFLAIGRMFYKGVTISNTQNVAVGLMNSVTTDIQNATSFGGSQAAGYYCFGGIRYSFKEGTKVSGSSYGVYRDAMVGANACSPPCTSLGNPSGCAPLSSPKEFLGTNMRISKFSVVPKVGTLYQVDLTVTYGDDSALIAPASQSPRCNGGQAGTQYCAISNLSNIVSVKDYNI